MNPGAPTIDRARHLRNDCAQLVAAATLRMNLMVPTCPEWNIEQLVAHLGSHHRWVTASIEAQDPTTETPDVPEPDLLGDELLDWLTAGVDELARLLENVPEDRPAWSWSGDYRKGFWSRRTTIETMIHRWDVENAVGAPQPLDAALAADGVDEMATVIVPLEGGPSSDVTPGTVHLIATDVGQEWSLTRNPEGTVGTREVSGDAPDLRVTGTAEALLLCLWGRGTAELDIDASGSASEELLKWLTA